MLAAHVVGRLDRVAERPAAQGVHGVAGLERRLAERFLGTGREEALRLTLVDYRERMHTNEPVHTWD